MKGIFKEVVSKKHIPFWAIVAIIVAIIILINTLITLTNFLGEEYAGIASIFILIVSLGLLGYWILKFLLLYHYKVIDEHLIFEKTIGNRTKVILDVKLDEIISVTKYKDLEVDNSIDKVYKFICSKEYDEFYVGEFIRKDKKYRFIFKPSKRLLDIIGENNKEVSKG